MRIYARTGPGWSPVVDQGAEGCRVLQQNLSFEELWAEDSKPLIDPASQEAYAVVRDWDSLLSPLPHADIACWAYAMTYASHRREVARKKMFRFPKSSPAQVMSGEIHFRPFLDYEAEVGILLHRASPKRFGFFMLNDLTDRSIQVLERTRTTKARALSYTRAKSFEGSLLVGPLIAIGESEDWAHLSIDLTVNGEIRQRVRALDCCLNPSAVHRDLFASQLDQSWLIAATGTAEGIMLTVPSLRQKIGLLRQSKFSGTRARQLHLSRQRFLQPGDVLEMRSATLGYSRSKVV